ncbi:hypothetical protein HO133_002351 [Letharia lupina]|uniref:DUF7730 domain-containing protein n=1 Tax=Letharia lupina TaxID=560253 RepID=A0A8H6FAR0_9LECA|nr:uncharacterized protein HO133_002351 [Letharia lupina]KAF6221495.1 hypothetical protein HO133_002351 [Letharia lupina]
MARIKKSVVTAQKPFPILSLPPEIRNHIWRYAVVKDENVTVRPHGRQESIQGLVPSCLRSGRELQRHREDDERRTNSTPLALAFTSRQLYLEVTPIYYSENSFYFPNSWYCISAESTLENFTAAIGPQNASNITVAYFDTLACPLNQYLSVLTGLKQLTVYPPPCAFVSTPYITLWRSQMSRYAQSHASVVIKHLENMEGARLSFLCKTPRDSRGMTWKVALAMPAPRATVLASFKTARSPKLCQPI